MARILVIILVILIFVIYLPEVSLILLAIIVPTFLIIWAIVALLERREKRKAKATPLETPVEIVEEEVITEQKPEEANNEPTRRHDELLRRHEKQGVLLKQCQELRVLLARQCEGYEVQLLAEREHAQKCQDETLELTRQLAEKNKPEPPNLPAKVNQPQDNGTLSIIESLKANKQLSTPKSCVQSVADPESYCTKEKYQLIEKIYCLSKENESLKAQLNNLPDEDADGRVIASLSHYRQLVVGMKHDLVTIQQNAEEMRTILSVLLPEFVRFFESNTVLNPRKRAELISEAEVKFIAENTALKLENNRIKESLASACEQLALCAADSGEVRELDLLVASGYNEFMCSNTSWPFHKDYSLSAAVNVADTLRGQSSRLRGYLNKIDRLLAIGRLSGVEQEMRDSLSRSRSGDVETYAYVGRKIEEIACVRNIQVVGMNYRPESIGEVLDNMSVGQSFRLKLEPENPADRQAIAVYSPSGMHVGYVKKDNLPFLHTLLSENRFLKCVLSEARYNFNNYFCIETDIYYVENAAKDE